MLTGNLAFSGESLGDLLLQICAQPLPSLIGAAPWLPPAVENWFITACAREPLHRYPTAQAFIDGLRAAAAAPAATPYPAPNGGGIMPAATPSYGNAPMQAYGAAPSTTGGSSLALPPQPPGVGSPLALLVVIAVVACAIAAGVAFVVIRGHKTTAAHGPPPVASWTPTPPPVVNAGAGASASTSTALTPLPPATTQPTVSTGTATASGTGRPFGPPPGTWHPPPGTTTTATAGPTNSRGIDLGY
jgi:serine/threonine-protein kinase